MNHFRAEIKKPVGNKWPDKWEPLIVRGIDTNGVRPLFLGFLANREDNYRLTHIVTKMPGYSWYYNQYHGTQYSGVSVNIYQIHSYMEFDDHIEFEVDLPWSEEFQQKKGK